MDRAWIETTVDPKLLADARSLGIAESDSDLIDTALRALIAQRQAAEVDRAYVRAYAQHPIDSPDRWGDLGSFRSALSG